ncbi:MAG: hypothetical protein JOZ19_05520 [Rubrobacter sp.]|nr:hypothetical protein [Rubrobacter sp.]
MSTVDERVIECTEGHYEVQEVGFGKVYRWCPKRIIVECDCGEKLTLTGPVTICRWCGVDHAAVLQEEEEVVGHQQLGDEILHPWRYVRDREDAGIPC